MKKVITMKGSSKTINQKIAIEIGKEVGKVVFKILEKSKI